MTSETEEKEKSKSTADDADEVVVDVAVVDETTPSMSLAMFFYLVVPVLLFAIFSRYTVDTKIKPIPLQKDRKPLDYEKRKPADWKFRSLDGEEEKAPVTAPAPKPLESIPSSWPTAYQDVVSTINSRRRRIVEVEAQSKPKAQPAKKASPTKSKPKQAKQPTPSPRKSRDSAKDPAKAKVMDQIDKLEKAYASNPNDIFGALEYADAMRFYELNFHDGGTYEKEAIALFETVVEMALSRKQKFVASGKSTKHANDPSVQFVRDEVGIDYRDKSVDGLLCAIYTAQGKVLFMANMFERAAASYSACLEIEPQYLDAVNSRGSVLLILGDYPGAARDLVQVVQEDLRRGFSDAFQGLARILQANEDAVEGGWDTLIEPCESVLTQLQPVASTPQANNYYSMVLSRIYHALFLYHDSKTNDTVKAFENLSNAYRHKMQHLAPWQPGAELAKIRQTKSIFTHGFWPLGVGSRTSVPIFIIGFVRSGSTLLERVLDSHPLIVGTGENSVFNGRLPEIRNEIVRASVYEPESLIDVTRDLADSVVKEMRRRWKAIDKATNDGDASTEETEPSRFVDKMLTNYYNVGFIHMLYPKALILHVVREPMDCLLSAYKHEFPPGALDYTCDFASLAELYQSYREIMDHWDDVLPGRVTHVRYEDMVNDMPGVAKKIIGKTGLPWDETVLDFHKKKHAVNTLSSTQVRKGVYRGSLQSWKKYEQQLQPLVDMIGPLASYDLESSL